MKVEIYGGNHSPWVQSVLLGLHEKNIEYSLRSLPPLATLKRWGVLMPTVSIDSGDWERESSEILTRLGFEPITERDLEAVKRAWWGVLHRPDSPFNFFSSFSLAGDSSDSLVKKTAANFSRSFITFYMFVLINFVKITRSLKDPENFTDQFIYWEEALRESTQKFINGDTPGAADIMLFGVIQCHSSIPVPPLEALRRDSRLERLRHWIAAMHERFYNYPYLYSGLHFEPKLAQPKPASFVQRGVFFAGLGSMFIAWPLTVPLVFFLMRKVPR
jgi:hypothetical protein